MFPFHKDQREAMEMNPITSIIIEKSMKNHKKKTLTSLKLAHKPFALWIHFNEV